MKKAICALLVLTILMSSMATHAEAPAFTQDQADLLNMIYTFVNALNGSEADTYSDDTSYDDSEFDESISSAEPSTISVESLDSYFGWPNSIFDEVYTPVNGSNYVYRFVKRPDGKAAIRLNSSSESVLEDTLEVYSEGERTFIRVSGSASLRDDGVLVIGSDYYFPSWINNAPSADEEMNQIIISKPVPIAKIGNMWYRIAKKKQSLNGQFWGGLYRYDSEWSDESETELSKSATSFCYADGYFYTSTGYVDVFGNSYDYLFPADYDSDYATLLGLCGDYLVFEAMNLEDYKHKIISTSRDGSDVNIICQSGADCADIYGTRLCYCVSETVSILDFQTGERFSLPLNCDDLVDLYIYGDYVLLQYENALCAYNYFTGEECNTFLTDADACFTATTYPAHKHFKFIIAGGWVYYLYSYDETLLCRKSLAGENGEAVQLEKTAYENRFYNSGSGLYYDYETYQIDTYELIDISQYLPEDLAVSESKVSTAVSDASAENFRQSSEAITSKDVIQDDEREKEAQYNAALELFDEGRYAEAENIFIELGDYRESSRMAVAAGALKPTLIPTPAATVETYKPGDIITFGHYEADGDSSNGKEAIEWQVLECDGKRAKLISVWGLEAKKFNDYEADNVTWEICTLRNWLNEAFLNTAFTSEEQAQLEEVHVRSGVFPGTITCDKVWLLSIPEVKKYFKDENARLCYPTQHAIKNGAVTQPNGADNWWLRPCNYFDDAEVTVEAVNGPDGSFYGETGPAYLNLNTVRPIISLRLS